MRTKHHPRTLIRRWITPMAPTIRNNSIDPKIPNENLYRNKNQPTHSPVNFTTNMLKANEDNEPLNNESHQRGYIDEEIKPIKKCQLNIIKPYKIK